MTIKEIEKKLSNQDELIEAISEAERNASIDLAYYQKNTREDVIENILVIQKSINAIIDTLDKSFIEAFNSDKKTVSNFLDSIEAVRASAEEINTHVIDHTKYPQHQEIDSENFYNA